MTEEKRYVADLRKSKKARPKKGPEEVKRQRLKNRESKVDPSDESLQSDLNERGGDPIERAGYT